MTDSSSPRRKTGAGARAALTRRSLLLGSSVVGLLSLPGVAWLGKGLAWGRALNSGALKDSLLSLLRNPAELRLLGRAYLWSRNYRRVGEHPTAQDLVSRIIPRHQTSALDLLNKRELRRWVRARVEEDFHAVRVVSVGGWMLSETEARLCALASIETATAHEL